MYTHTHPIHKKASPRWHNKIRHPTPFCLTVPRPNRTQTISHKNCSTHPLVKEQSKNGSRISSTPRRTMVIASALQLLHLVVGQLLPVLFAVAHSPVAVSVAVHLTLQSKPATKVRPDGKTYGEQGQGLAAQKMGRDRTATRPLLLRKRLNYRNSRN